MRPALTATRFHCTFESHSTKFSRMPGKGIDRLCESSAGHGLRSQFIIGGRNFDGFAYVTDIMPTITSRVQIMPLLGEALLFA